MSDPLLAEAVDLVVSTQACGVLMLQRHLNIGYTRAKNLIDLMRDLGVVGGFGPQAGYAVRMTADEWRLSSLAVADAAPNINANPTARAAIEAAAGGVA